MTWNERIPWPVFGLVLLLVQSTTVLALSPVKGLNLQQPSQQQIDKFCQQYPALIQGPNLTKDDKAELQILHKKHCQLKPGVIKPKIPDRQVSGEIDRIQAPVCLASNSEFRVTGKSLRQHGLVCRLQSRGQRRSLNAYSRSEQEFRFRAEAVLRSLPGPDYVLTCAVDQDRQTVKLLACASPATPAPTQKGIAEVDLVPGIDIGPLSPGENQTLNVSVHNRGQGDASTRRYQLILALTETDLSRRRLSTFFVGRAGDRVLMQKQQWLTLIPAGGQSETVPMTLSLPVRQADSKSWFLCVVVDGQQDVIEFDENNNIRCYPADPAKTKKRTDLAGVFGSGVPKGDSSDDKDDDKEDDDPIGPGPLPEHELFTFRFDQPATEADTTVYAQRFVCEGCATAGHIFAGYDTEVSFNYAFRYPGRGYTCWEPGHERIVRSLRARVFLPVDVEDSTLRLDGRWVTGGEFSIGVCDGTVDPFTLPDLVRYDNPGLKRLEFEVDELDGSGAVVSTIRERVLLQVHPTLGADVSPPSLAIVEPSQNECRIIGEPLHVRIEGEAPRRSIRRVFADVSHIDGLGYDGSTRITSEDRSYEPSIDEIRETMVFPTDGLTPGRYRVGSTLASTPLSFDMVRDSRGSLILDHYSAVPPIDFNLHHRCDVLSSEYIEALGPDFDYTPDFDRFVLRIMPNFRALQAILPIQFAVLDEEKVRALEEIAAAEDFLQKPADLNSVRELMENLLGDLGGERLDGDDTPVPDTGLGGDGDDEDFLDRIDELMGGDQRFDGSGFIPQPTEPQRQEGRKPAGSDGAPIHPADPKDSADGIAATHPSYTPGQAPSGAHVQQTRDSNSDGDSSVTSTYVDPATGSTHIIQDRYFGDSDDSSRTEIVIQGGDVTIYTTWYNEDGEVDRVILPRNIDPNGDTITEQEAAWARWMYRQGIGPRVDFGLPNPNDDTTDPSRGGESGESPIGPRLAVTEEQLTGDPSLWQASGYPAGLDPETARKMFEDSLPDPGPRPEPGERVPTSGDWPAALTLSTAFLRQELNRALLQKTDPDIRNLKREFRLPPMIFHGSASISLYATPWRNFCDREEFIFEGNLSAAMSYTGGDTFPVRLVVNTGLETVSGNVTIRPGRHSYGSGHINIPKSELCGVDACVQYHVEAVNPLDTAKVNPAVRDACAP